MAPALIKVSPLVGNTLAFFGALALGLVGFNEGRRAYLTIVPPSRFLAVTVESIDEGAMELPATYTFDRVRYCQADLNLFIARMPENEIVWRTRVPGGATTTIGRTVVKNHFRIPNYFKPGMYELRTITYAQCAEGSHTMPAPDGTFEIRSATASPPADR